MLQITIPEKRGVMSRVLVAMSGGVDSSVCAAKLVSEGYECIGVTMHLQQCSQDADIQDAKDVCDALGIEHVVVDLRSEFDAEVVSQFVQGYVDGTTPNPCILCNRSLKFGKLIELADEYECDFMATGHYAHVNIDDEGVAHLVKSANEKKDQSYVLWSVPQSTLKRVLLPLGDFENKEEVRAYAREHGFNAASKGDSQDICFIPNGRYPEFLEQYLGKKPMPGPIVDEFGEVVGQHKGLTSYTLGQRKGVGVAAQRKIYVTGKDADSNTLFVGANDLLFAHEFYVEQVNWCSGEIPTEPIHAQICATYQGRLFDCIIHPLEGGRARIETEEAMRAVCPGQSAVAYCGDEVIFGGIIEKPELEKLTALQEFMLSTEGFADLLELED